MFFTDFFPIGAFFFTDLLSMEHCIFSFIGAIFLPVLLCVVLVSALGGNGQDMAQAVGETLAACMAMALELCLRLGQTLFVSLIAFFSALVRLALSWRQNSKFKIKTGTDTDTNTGRGARGEEVSKRL